MNNRIIANELIKVAKELIAATSKNQIKKDFEEAMRKVGVFSNSVDFGVREKSDEYELYVMNRGKNFPRVGEILKRKYPNIEPGERDFMSTNWVIPKD